jgi:Putative bacterial sensory transduction regulator
LRTLCIITAALALAFVSQAFVLDAGAQARSIPDEGMTFEDVAAWLREQGKEVTISQDSLGNKIIVTSTDGMKFSVYMFDCQNDRCGSLQFATGPHASATGKLELERINEWNKTKRWARAYLNGPNSLWIEADFDLSPGSSYELLNDEMATWAKALAAIKPFFGTK